MNFQCPMCEKVIVPLIDPIVPSTWNDCCSPECGNEMEGYEQALLEQASEVSMYENFRIQQKRWNEWECWRLIILMAEMQRDCEHEWMTGTGEIQEMIRMAAATELTRYRMRVCQKCMARSQGDVISTEVKSHVQR